ncbi:UPF0345 protein Bcep1808_5077 [Salmonella enterica subsp. enterica serovar Typhimurium]|nr:UPF0345 protein Bcep1808_5077 [Salmonella enterica subsp. enterica serovar Typhimurium]
MGVNLIMRRGLIMLQSNEYFSGKVKSIGFTSSSTGRASVGVMAEGEYTFGTAEPEEMTVVSGALKVLLPELSNGKCIQPVRCLTCLATASFISRLLSRLVSVPLFVTVSPLSGGEGPSG